MTTRRIGLIMQGGAGWMGGFEYVRNLVLAWAALGHAERAGFELHLISGSPLDEALSAQLGPHLAGVHVLSKALPSSTLPNRVRWLLDRRLRGRPNSRFAEFIARERFDFLYPLTYDNQYNIGVTLPIGGALGNCRWAGWIPDFQHRFMPELFQGKEIAKRDAGIATLAQEARTIIFSSESSAADFRSFYPASPARIEILRFHTRSTAAWFEQDAAVVQQHFHLPGQFLLVSNQFWQHKNHRTLFEALALLGARGLRPNLVCTGHPGDFRSKDYFNSLLRLVHELGIAPQVHILGLIERSEQLQLMRRSLAVVQPSLFEGWSTVLEDARALGKPVIASDIAVHREQNPPGCRFFQKDAPQDLARVIEEVWPTLAPGPDGEREAAARTTSEKNVVAYGQRFLEIIKNCLK